MTIDPDTSTNDDSALSQHHVDLDSTSEAGTMLITMSHAMPRNWKFNKDDALIITSKQKEDESVM
eukprot:10196221-Ditylum_brightwellii.AAC.1